MQLMKICMQSEMTCTRFIVGIGWDDKYRGPNGGDGLGEEKSNFGDGCLAQKVVREDLDGLRIVLDLAYCCQHSQENPISQVKATNIKTTKDRQLVV